MVTFKNEKGIATRRRRVLVADGRYSCQTPRVASRHVILSSAAGHDLSVDRMPRLQEDCAESGVRHVILGRWQPFNLINKTRDFLFGLHGEGSEHLYVLLLF